MLRRGGRLESAFQSFVAVTDTRLLVTAMLFMLKVSIVTGMASPRRGRWVRTMSATSEDAVCQHMQTGDNAYQTVHRHVMLTEEPERFQFSLESRIKSSSAGRSTGGANRALSLGNL